MELIDLSLIKPMLMRSLENPEAIKLFINYNLWFLGSLELLLLNVFIICSLWYIAYLLRKSKVWENKDKKERKRIIKDVFIEYLHKAKKPLRKMRHLIIWGILIACAWIFVSMIFSATMVLFISSPRYLHSFFWLLFVRFIHLWWFH